MISSPFFALNCIFLIFLLYLVAELLYSLVIANSDFPCFSFAIFSGAMGWLIFFR